MSLYMEVTEDSIWSTGISLLQPKHGYRFGIDSVLLGHFLQSGADDDVLEIGAGTGVISILLKRLCGFRSLVAIEIQKELAGLCSKNFERNRVRNAIVHHADVRTFHDVFPDVQFDLIFSNPPYRKTGTGKLNPDRQKQIARHEVLLTLPELFRCASQFLKPAGRLSLVLPIHRESDLLQLIQSNHWRRQQRQYVHSFASGPPVLLMCTLTRSRVSERVLPPLAIYSTSGKYTDAVKKMIG